MKNIKSKKVFRVGLFWLLIGVMTGVMTFDKQDNNVNSLFICVISFGIGAYWIHSSFDVKKANRLLITYFDEREEYIESKVRSTVYAITRSIVFISIVVLGILSKFHVFDQQLLLCSILTLIFVYFVMVFTYVITYAILERKL